MSWELKPWKWPPTSGKKREGYAGASLVCPHCHHDARFVERRDKWCHTLLGPLRLTRCYYHCRACGRGHVPRDETLGLNATMLTPAASEVVCIAGVQTSFAQAAEVTLSKLCGLKLSESTIERVTETTGERLAELLIEQVTFGEPETWEWQCDAQGRTTAYVSLDWTGVRQQGERGAAVDGRMACVGMVYNARSEHDSRPNKPHEVRYLAGFYDLDELGLQMRRQAAQVGWDNAEQQLAISDGGVGLEEFFRRNFPLAECILDFWHAKEHLVELAQALWPDNEATRQSWITTQCHRLKREGGQAVLNELSALDVSERSGAAQESHRQHTQYFRNHVARMDYPRYVSQGWQIGSGPVESACKTVVGNRLKGSGMRWGEAGSDAVCHLRALYLSQPSQWEAFWTSHPN